MKISAHIYAVCALLCALTVAVDALYVYIGSSSSAPGGIQIYKQNNDGTLVPAYLVQVDTPWFLALHPNGKIMYVAGNQVYLSYSVQPNGNLTLLNTQPCHGQGPTHVSVHPSGNWLFGANYDDGTFVSFPLAKSGEIGQIADLKKPGSAAWTVEDRQEGPHAHMIAPSPYNASHVMGMDLGADKIFVFALDTAKGKLNTNGVPYGQVGSGQGCRHIAFHPSKNVAYVLAEMGNSVYVYAYDPARGSLTTTQTLSTLPDDYDDSVFTKAAEIRVHPNGQYVYATNRGHDSIAAYKVQDSGKLTLVGWASSHGHSPRGMNVDPTGKFLYTANEDGTVASFKVDPATGMLQNTGVVKTPNAVDVEFGSF